MLTHAYLVGPHNKLTSDAARPSMKAVDRYHKRAREYEGYKSKYPLGSAPVGEGHSGD